MDWSVQGRHQGLPRQGAAFPTGVSGAEESMPSYVHCVRKTASPYTSYNKNLKSKQIGIKFCALSPEYIAEEITKFR